MQTRRSPHTSNLAFDLSVTCRDGSCRSGTDVLEPAVRRVRGGARSLRPLDASELPVFGAARELGSSPFPSLLPSHRRRRPSCIRAQGTRGLPLAAASALLSVRRARLVLPA